MNKKYAFLLFSVSISTNSVADVMDVLIPNISVPNACVFQNTGVYQGGFVMVPVYEDTIYNCQGGYYLPELSENCTLCPENHYCPGGDYTYSESGAVGLFACPDATFAPIGMWENAQCGRRFHVDNDVLFLRTTKQTEHALHIDINGDGVADFFANLTTADVPMNKDTNRRLKIKIDDVVYSAYDDTINPNEQSAVTE